MTERTANRGGDHFGVPAHWTTDQHKAMRTGQKGIDSIVMALGLPIGQTAIGFRKVLAG